MHITPLFLSQSNRENETTYNTDMNRIITLALSILEASALLFTACQKAPELTLISPTSIELSADGGSDSITFTANRDWRVSSSDSWVSISPSSGPASDGAITVTVRCNANTTYDDRTATVIISMEELSQTVTIRQPANKGVVLPKQVFDLQSGSNTIEVEVQANVQYTVSISVDWIKQTDTKALTSKTLTFSIEENKTYDPREGMITIKPQDSGIQEQVISVKQAQKDALIINKTSYDMPYGGGEIEIKVEANVSFDVMPNVDWIHYTQTKALSTSTIILQVEPNESYEAREGQVIVKPQGKTAEQTIMVKQAANIKEGANTLDASNVSPFEATLQGAFSFPDGVKYGLGKIVFYYSSTINNIEMLISSGTRIEWGYANQQIIAVSVELTTLTPCTTYYYVVAYESAAQNFYGETKSFKTPDFPELIDLGLSVKWRSMNVDAKSWKESGGLYAWGEVETKSTYSMENYKWCAGTVTTLTKYNTQAGNGVVDNKTRLDPEDDVAHVKLGSSWRMPTDSEIAELFNNQKINWKRITVDGVTGYKVKSRYTGNYIFLPETDDEHHGFYWSSELTSTPYIAAGFRFGTAKTSHEGGVRGSGFGVRPVSE